MFLVRKLPELILTKIPRGSIMALDVASTVTASLEVERVEHPALHTPLWVFQKQIRLKHCYKKLFKYYMIYFAIIQHLIIYELIEN